MWTIFSLGGIVILLLVSLAVAMRRRRRRSDLGVLSATWLAEQRGRPLS